MHKTWLFLSAARVTNARQDFCNPRGLPHVVNLVTNSTTKPVSNMRTLHAFRLFGPGDADSVHLWITSSGTTVGYNSARGSDCSQLHEKSWL